MLNGGPVWTSSIRRIARKKPRSKTSIAVLGAFGLLLAACGSGSSQSSSQSSSSTTAAGGANLGSLTVVAAVAHTFFYLPSAYGVQLGVWKKAGLNVRNVIVAGGGQSAQLLASGSADIELGTGPTDMNAIMRGLKAKIVGAAGLSFKPFVLIVPENSPIKSASELKGHTIGITGKGALTDYVVKELEKHYGWADGSVTEAPLGGLSEQLAAMKSGTTDGFVWTAGAGFNLEHSGQGKILFSFSKFVPPQLFEDLTASDSVIKQRPAAVSAYVKGWYQVANYMKSHPQQTIQFVSTSYGVPLSVATKIYNYEIVGLSMDGSIPQANLNGLLQSAVTQGITSQPPSASQVFDGQFLPKTS